MTSFHMAQQNAHIDSGQPAFTPTAVKTQSSCASPAGGAKEWEVLPQNMASSIQISSGAYLLTTARTASRLMEGKAFLRSHLTARRGRATAPASGGGGGLESMRA